MPIDISFATYAHLAQGRWQVRELDPDYVAEDPDLMEALRDATAGIDSELPGVWFTPRVQTRYFNAPSAFSDGDVREYDLKLDIPLRELTSITNGDGTVLTSDDYTLIPREGAPYTSIRLNRNAAYYWKGDTSGETRSKIVVSGVWAGSSIRFIAGAWLTSNDTVQNTISSTGTREIVVADANGVDYYRRTPRLSPGMLIRTTVNGATEYHEILAISTGDAPHTLYVERGARGTSALASIPSTTVIEVWQPDRNIVTACARWAAFMLRRRGVFKKAEFDAVTGAAVRLETVMPEDVKAILDRYRTTENPGRNRILAV